MNKQYLKMLDMAINYHKGQFDKGGMPYIMHPLWVSSHLDEMEDKIVGLGHDLIEDTCLEISDFQGFSSNIISAITAITRWPDQTYTEYLKAVYSNPIARRVKIMDIRHNTLPERLEYLSDDDIVRLVKKYANALKILC